MDLLLLVGGIALILGAIVRYLRDDPDAWVYAAVGAALSFLSGLSSGVW